ncbi:unnamed protein product [Rotaria sp. Silwood1]|nr:unnamed protein product [Rotaria sp. Silwood1]
MQVGNFSSADYAEDGQYYFMILETVLGKPTQLFRFIPVDYYTPNVYRITNKFYGPTRSLFYNDYNDAFGFEQTNHTSSYQHWSVILQETGNYQIKPVNTDKYMTAMDDRHWPAPAGVIDVLDEEVFCAWCLVKDGDYIGRNQQYAR